MKKLGDLVDKRFVKKTKLNTLNTKINSLEKKISDATTLIHINQYNRLTKFGEKYPAVDKKNARR